MASPHRNWEDYPKDFVKNYMLYLIATSVQDHYTIKFPDENQEVPTLAPEGAFNALPAGITQACPLFPFVPDNNPKSLLRFKVLNSSPSNTSDYPIVLNDVRNVRTSSLQATNGTVLRDRQVPADDAVPGINERQSCFNKYCPSIAVKPGSAQAVSWFYCYTGHPCRWKHFIFHEQVIVFSQADGMLKKLPGSIQ